MHNFPRFLAQGAPEDGASPDLGLTYRNGLLYGATEKGGRYRRGTIFQIDPLTGQYLQLSGFHGTTALGGSAGGLTAVNDWLFGTSRAGGATGSGTIFGYNLSDGAVHSLYSFKGHPDSHLKYIYGELYGTTTSGGMSDDGTIFKLNPWTGKGTELHQFERRVDGSNPVGGLIFYRGKFYGATQVGTGNGCFGGGCGTLYSFDPATGVFSTIHRFTGGGDGGQPGAQLTVFRGNLYGTTLLGGKGCGANGCGTIFGYDMRRQREFVVYSFLNSDDEALPVGPLTECDGGLCGTTSMGGTYSGGTAFRFVS